MKLVDIEEISFRAGVALSFLIEEEQQMIADAIDCGTIRRIDLKTAEELKTISKAGQLNETVIR